MRIKQELIPKLKEISPHALIICLANKQDLPNRLKSSTVENILNERAYDFIATDEKFRETIANIMFETILLRIEQIEEFECPYLLKKAKK